MGERWRWPSGSLGLVVEIWPTCLGQVVSARWLVARGLDQVVGGRVLGACGQVVFLSFGRVLISLCGRVVFFFG